MLTPQTRKRVQEQLESIGSGRGGYGEQRPALEALTALANGNVRPALGVLRREIRRRTRFESGEEEPTEDLSTLVNELASVT